MWRVFAARLHCFVCSQVTTAWLHALLSAEVLLLSKSRCHHKVCHWVWSRGACGQRLDPPGAPCGFPSMQRTKSSPKQSGETYTPATFMCVSASTEHIYRISMQRAGNEKTDRCSPLHNNEAWHEFYSKVSLSARRGDLVVISVGLLLSHIRWRLHHTWLRYKIICLVTGSR